MFEKSRMNQTQSGAIEQSLLRNTYLWMCFALGVTAITAYLAQPFMRAVGGFQLLILGIATIGLSMYLQARIMQLKSVTAFNLFTLYSVLMGLFLSPILSIYAQATISSAFFITAGTFGIMAVYGHTTKSNLQGIGHYLSMAVLGLILAFIVNAIFRISGLSMLINYAAVVIFTVMAAYDAQRLKLLAEEFKNSDQHTMTAISLVSALHLYLTFINLFLAILRILGRRD